MVVIFIYHWLTLLKIENVMANKYEYRSVTGTYNLDMFIWSWTSSGDSSAHTIYGGGYIFEFVLQ